MNWFAAVVEKFVLTELTKSLLNTLVPTRPETVTPGTITAADWMLWAAGSASSTSRVKTVCRVKLCTSTRGVAPDTVIVFRNRSHPEVAVHGRREVPRQLDAFASDRVEAGQREDDGV